MEVKLDNDTMRTMVAKAVFDSFDDDAKAKLVQEAIRSLFEERAQYGSKTKIQQIFDDAVSKVAAEFVATLMREEYGEKIQDVVRNALDRAFAETERMNKVVEEVAGAIGRGLTKERY